jgi:hypothetical protein
MTKHNLKSQRDYKELSRDEVIELFKEALDNSLVKKYKKTSQVLARPAKKGERIVTSVKGEDRTENRAKANDFIIKNPSGEEYIVSEDIFSERYKLIGKNPETSDYKQYQAIGTVWGFQYKGPDSKIEAPWGEKQIVKNGDMIVSRKKDDFKDIYSVQLDIFKDTYETVNNGES